MPRRLAEPDNMPLVRAYEIWLERTEPDPQNADLLSIMLATYVRMRHEYTVEDAQGAIQMALDAMERNLMDGSQLKDPVTLEPRITVVKEVRDSLGEVQYRQLLSEWTDPAVPDFVPENL